MSKIRAALQAKLNRQGGAQARAFRETQRAVDAAQQTPEAEQAISIADTIIDTPVNILSQSMVSPTQEEVTTVPDQGTPVATREGAVVTEGPAQLQEGMQATPTLEEVKSIQELKRIPSEETIAGQIEGDQPVQGQLTDVGVAEQLEQTLLEGAVSRSPFTSDQNAIDFGQNVNRILADNYRRQMIDADGSPRLELGALLNVGAEGFKAKGDEMDIFGATINIDPESTPEETQSDVNADAQGFIKKYAGKFLGSIMAKDKLNMLNNPNDANSGIRGEFGRAAMLGTILELGNRIQLQDAESDKIENDRRFDDALDRVNIGKAIARRIERLLYPSLSEDPQELFDGNTKDFGYKSRLTDDEQSILGQMIVQGFADSPFVDFFQSRLIKSKDGKEKMTFVSTRAGDLQLPLIRRAIMQELGMQGHERPVSLVPLLEGRLKGEAVYSQKEITTQLKKNKKTDQIKDAIQELSKVAHTTSQHKNDLMEGMLKNAEVNMEGWFAKVAKQDSKYLRDKAEELYEGYVTKAKEQNFFPSDVGPNYADFKQAAKGEALRIQQSHLAQRKEQLEDAIYRQGKAFYYGYTVINNSSRLMITNTELNYQSDKVARFLVDGANPVIFRKGSAKEKAFYLVVARSLVKDADKMKTEGELLAAFNQDKNKFIQFGKQLTDYTKLKERIRNSTPESKAEFEKRDQGLVISPELESYLADLGKDEFYFAMDALHELNEYEATPPGQQFATRLKAEMDGNANGAVIQGMQMGIAKILERGGILYKKPGEITTEDGEQLVEDIRYQVFEVMERLDKTSKDMQLTDILEKIRAKPKGIKDLLKEPIMTTIYGKDSEFHFPHAKRFIMKNQDIFKNIIAKEESIDGAARILTDYIKDSLNVGLGGAIEHSRMMKKMGRAFNFANKIVEIEGANGYMVQAGGFEYLESSKVNIKFGPGLANLSLNDPRGTRRQSTTITTFRREASAQVEAAAKRIESGRKNVPKIGSKLRNQLAVNGTQNIDATVAQNTVSRVAKANPEGLVMQVYDAFMGDVNTYSQLKEVSNEEFLNVNKNYNMIIAEQKAFLNLLSDMKREIQEKKNSNQTYDIGINGTHRSMADFLINYGTIIRNEVHPDDIAKATKAVQGLDFDLRISGFNKKNPPAHLFIDADTFENIFNTAIEALDIKNDLQKMILKTQAAKQKIEEYIKENNLPSRQYS